MSIAHLYTFSYKPFTTEGRRAKLLASLTCSEDTLKGPLIPFPAAVVHGLPLEQGGDSGKRGFFQRDRGSNSNLSLDASMSTAEVYGLNPLHFKSKSSSMSQSAFNGHRGHINAGHSGSNSNTMLGILDRNFASNAAVRDFNESMPVIVLPSNFTPEKGRVALSRPSDRVSE